MLDDLVDDVVQVVTYMEDVVVGDEEGGGWR